MVKILLVEDNEMKRDMLSRWLKRKGYEVFIAVDGQEGVNMATSESTSVILLDMSLLIMDSWETARNLKANTDTKGIPILRLSAHAITSDPDKAIAAGCDDYDAKPLDFNHLPGKIKALLDTSDAG